MKTSSNCVLWDPFQTLLEKNISSSRKYGLLILNTQISLKPTFLFNLWQEASVKVLVDGGANRWLSFLRCNNFNLKSASPPDLLTGDMDSCTKETKEYFEKWSSTRVIVTPDQIETDFTKALREVYKFMQCKSLWVDDLFVAADPSGRFDHIMANVNTLFYANSILPQVNVYLFSGESLTWLLQIGKHTIKVPSVLQHKDAWCSIVPISGPAVVTTTGLKWNLENGTLQFGSLVSTSNTYDGSPQVTISTNSPVLWSMSVDYIYLKS